MTTEKIVTVKTLENEIYGGKLSGKTYESNIVLHDNYGNAVEVTAGFKIASDSGENVEEGVVIEDVSAKDRNSKGNQFVWIPIGNVTYSRGVEEIKLGRYTFSEDGTPNMEQSADDYELQLQ